MSEKKIVSIEDRIPKLKQARKKKANRRLIFYLTIFFMLISIVVYLQSSLSHVQHVEISGNNYISESDIKELSQITTDDNFWSVKKKKVETTVLTHPEIKKVEVTKKFPSTIGIKIQELDRVGYIKHDEAYFSLLENGELLRNQPLKTINGDAPLLSGFEKETYLQELIKELQKLPDSIVNLISEITWTPTDGNPYKILMYMNDGYEVEGSIRNFSNTMKSYPSIVSQLEPGSEGIIHIGVGAYFESTGQEVREEQSDEVPEQEESNNEADG